MKNEQIKITGANNNNNPEKEAGVKYSETRKIVFSKTITKSEFSFV